MSVSEPLRELLELMEAIRSSNLSSVQEILSITPSLLSTPDPDGRLPLHHSITAKSWSTFEYLIRNGADVLARDHAGWSALHMAASVGEVSMASILVSHAELHEQASSTSSISNTSSISLSSSVSPRAAHFVNLQNESGRTALHYASSKGHTEMVSLLIKHGANVEIKDSLGQTALHRAASVGHATIARILCDTQPRIVNEIDAQKKTALELAIEDQHEDVVQVIKQYLGE